MIVTVHSQMMTAPYEYEIRTLDDLKNLLYKHNGKVTIASKDIYTQIMKVINDDD